MESEASHTKPTRSKALLVFFLLLLAYSYIHQGPGWNQNSRLDLLHAAFINKTLQIDAYQTNTGDKSYEGGHYYSEKPPGIAVLATPAFAISLLILDCFGLPPDSTNGWFVSGWITTVGSVGLITALGGVAMFVFLRRIVEEHYALTATITVFLGACPFPYATMLFSHAAIVGLICIALWAIGDDCFFSIHQPNAPRASRRFLSAEDSARNASFSGRHLLAGACCGLAIASEFTSATAAGAVLALASLTTVKRGLLVAAGAVLPLLLIPAYNTACFGSPLAFGYQHLISTEFQGMNHGLFGITFPPKLSAAYLILLSPQRGLFFWTPFFLIVFAGLRLFLQSASTLFWTSLIILIVHIVCIAGYYMPSGGAALGPRHLAPILPFLALCSIFGLRRYPILGFMLGLWSILLTGIATSISAKPPESISNPLSEFYLPCLLSNQFRDTLGAHLGLSAYFSVSLLLALIVTSYFWSWFHGRRRSTGHERVAVPMGSEAAGVVR